MQPYERMRKWVVHPKRQQARSSSFFAITVQYINHSQAKPAFNTKIPMAN